MADSLSTFAAITRDSTPLSERFDRQVEATPAASAVIANDQIWTYRDLQNQTEIVADNLTASGAGPEALVAVSAHRSPELVAVLVGIMKSGAAFLPVDPDLPLDRRNALLSDARPTLLIVDDANAAEGYDGPVLLTQEVMRKTSSGVSASDVRIEPDHPAYVLYTSGSTGQPKGVVVCHRAIENRICWMQDQFKLAGGDRVLQKTPIGFDVSVWEFFWPLISGAAIVIARPGGHREPGYLLNVIERQQVTCLHFVPSMLRVFLETEDLERCTKLRQVFSSGEVLSRSLADRFFDVLGADLHNLYGPTEAAIDVSHHRCIKGDTGSVPIGRPIDGVQLYVLDRELGEIANGDSGEIYIGGEALARGYLNRPGITAENFLPDPFSSQFGARLYRTGDRGRWSSTGELEFLGRTDDQVKIRGVRIELSEVTEAIADHPKVRDAAVLATTTPQADQCLIAFVTPNWSQRDIPTSEIEAWRRVYEESYDASSAVDTQFDTASWISSYTGEAIPDAEMRELVDNSVRRVLRHTPNSVLEIGCGTGLLVFPIASQCDRYVATDFASSAISSVENGLRSSQLPVELVRRAAHEFDRDDYRSFDAVLINGVTQHFPNLEYLQNVLAGSINATRDGGIIFVGGVRSLPLMPACHASILAHRAPPSERRSEILQRLETAALTEEELCIAPHWFETLIELFPRLRAVELQPLSGSSHNEFTRFRFDVTLHIGDGPIAGISDWLSWAYDIRSLDRLRAILEDGQLEQIAVCEVPNTRLESELSVLAWIQNPTSSIVTIAEERAEVERVGRAGIDLHDVEEIAEKHSYSADFYLARSGNSGAFDLVLSRESSQTSTGRVWGFSGAERLPTVSKSANDPAAARWRASLPREIKAYLKSKLPEQMVPDFVVALDELPIGTNGKLNRAALIKNYQPMRSVPTGVPPRNAVEVVLCDIWSDVLGVEPLMPFDDFFDLGGNSLMATHIAQRIHELLRIEVTIRSVVEARTVATLATALATASGGIGRLTRICELRREVSGLTDAGVQAQLERTS